MKTIEEFVTATHKNDKYIQRPRIHCNDGFSMSVQGPKQTVYGWVPVEIINQVIEKHGGINEAKTFGREAPNALD